MNTYHDGHGDACGCPGCVAYTKALNGQDGEVVAAAPYGFRLFNNKWGDRTQGTPGGAVTYSIDLSDISPYRGQYAAEQFYQIVRDAFQTWSSVSNIDFVEVNDGGQLDVRTTTDGFATDGTWGVPGGTLGRGGSSSRNGSNTSGIVWLDATEPYVPGGTNPFGSINFRLVTLHEMGHAIGLNHVSGEGRQLMNSRIGPEGLFSGDIAGVQALYGEREWTDDAETVQLKWVQVGQTVHAEGGDDTIFATSKADTIYGGAGDDTTSAGSGDDKIYDSLGRNTINAGNNNDLVVGGSGQTNADGGNGDDIIIGGKGDDTLEGGAGNDTIRGDAQSSFFHGNDIITAGAGDDFIEGGGGSDTLVFGLNEGTNTIAELKISGNNSNNTSAVGIDFESGVDVIDVRAFDFDSLAEAFSHVADVDGHAQFSNGGTVIIFYGLDQSDLSQNDFLV